MLTSDRNGLGWLLFGVFGDKSAAEGRLTAQLLLGGALIGGVIGYFVVGVEAIRDRNPVRFARLASYGVALGAVGGAVGMVVGDWVNFHLVGALGASREGTGAWHTLGTMLARGLGWTFLGVAVGFSEGIAARSLGKLSCGAVGGFVGGALFGLLYLMTRDESGSASLWGAIGLIILGACIGSLSALVQGVLRPASLRVLRGWQEGREYALDKGSSLLGRDEHFVGVDDIGGADLGGEVANACHRAGSRRSSGGGTTAASAARSRSARTARAPWARLVRRSSYSGSAVTSASFGRWPARCSSPASRSSRRSSAREPPGPCGLCDAGRRRARRAWDHPRTPVGFS